ncbi:MAG: hypothetical protein AAGA66_04730 [Bacteroidota bacterium]
MKQLLSKMYVPFIALAAMMVMTSCENEFKADEISPNTNPPTVLSISTILEDQEVTQGVLQGSYMVRGENLSSLVSIQINGLEASFNPALLTDGLTFVNIPVNTPLTGSNTMRIETLGGVTEVDFPLLRITGFTENVVGGVKVVELEGVGFSYAPSVSFQTGSAALGNLVVRESNVVSFTDTTIVAEVPDGVIQAFITVSTERGATDVSDSYGFSLPLFTDELSAGWEVAGWGGSQEPSATEQALGTASIKSVREAWSGLTLNPEVGVDFNEYEFISVQIYGGTNATRVKLALNGDFESGLELDITPDSWNQFVIRLTDFYLSGTEPDEITRIDFQEFSGSGESEYIFYVDDLGFL